MPEPETIAWLKHTASCGQASSQVMLEVLERLERLEAMGAHQLPRLEQRLEALEAAQPAAEPIDEAENDRRFRACMKAIDEAFMQAPTRLRCPGAHTIAECGGPCVQGFEHCDCGLRQQLNPANDSPDKVPNQPGTASESAGLSLIDEVAWAMPSVGQVIHKSFAKRELPRRRLEAYRAIAVIVRRLRERNAIGSSETAHWLEREAANWLEQEAAK